MHNLLLHTISISLFKQITPISQSLARLYLYLTKTLRSNPKLGLQDKLGFNLILYLTNALSSH